MFRSFARLPLRRCLHSQANPSPRSFTRHSRTLYALGASTTVAGYLVWSWHADARRISLDAEPVSAPIKKSTSLKQTTAPTPSDAPTSSAPMSEAPTSASTSLESEDASKTPLEMPQEGQAMPEEQGESSGGAFNPETGEINWDCPCLGGMAHGPCGPQFREAFSCFVYSEADPKGIECVEKFRAMQDCFREHPDVYGEEIMDDDEEQPPSDQLPEKPESSQEHSDVFPLETTQQPATSASS